MPPTPLLPAPLQTTCRLLLVLLLAAVCALSFHPAPPTGMDTGWDKANHLLAFVALTLLAEAGFWSAWTPAQRRLRVALGLLAFGLFIEVVQAGIPSRSAEAADLLADALGIALGLLPGVMLRQVRSSARRPPGTPRR